MGPDPLPLLALEEARDSNGYGARRASCHMPIAERVHRKARDHRAPIGRARGRLVRAPLGLWVLIAALQPGCGSTDGNASPGEVGIYDPDGSPFGSTPPGDGGGASLAVSVAPPGAALCPGQCVDLSAQAVGGTAPYSYRWNPGPPGTAESLHACPSATTTYTVTATDSSGRSGELGGAPARGSASATVTVSSPLDCRADAQSDAAADAFANAPTDSSMEMLVDTSSDGPVGSPADAWTGCEVVTAPMLNLADSGLCQPGDSGVGILPFPLPLPEPLLAGQSYSITLDIPLTVPTAPAVNAAVWGSTGDCVYGQRLTTQPLAFTPLISSTPRITFCATVDANYSRLVVGTYLPSPASGGWGSGPPTAQVCAISTCVGSDR
jgi:hypothetical protein